MRYALAFLLLISGWVLGAGAQPLVVENGEQVTAGEEQSDEKDLPDVAAQPDGGYVVVWVETAQVFARGFDAAGRARGIAQPLSSGRAFETGTMPRAAALPGGRFVVVWVASWIEYRPYRWLTRAMVRLVDAAGTPLGAAAEVGAFAPPPITMVGDPSLRSDPPPSVAVDRAGVVAVAWSLIGELQMRRYDASGPQLQTIAWPGGFPILALGNGLEAQLAAVPGGWLLARVVDHSRVSIEMLDADARPRGSAWTYTLTLPTGFSFQQLLALRVMADESGRFLLVWHEVAFDVRRYPLVGMLDRVRAQRFAADGRAIGEVVDLLHADRLDLDPELVSFTLGDVKSRRDGTFLLTWNVGRTYYDCGGVRGIL